MRSRFWKVAHGTTRQIIRYLVAGWLFYQTVQLYVYSSLYMYVIRVSHIASLVCEIFQKRISEDRLASASPEGSC